MQKAIQIHIPQPCHEDWQQMTPVDKGRFCQSCAKQVVDFSMMSDQQILNYISNAAGKLCGRFAEDQLQRPLLPVKQEKKKMWWLAAMMPLVMVFGKVGAQKKLITQNTAAIILKEPDNIIVGKIRVPEKGTAHLPAKRTLSGRVIDESGKELPFVNITIDGEHIGVQADSTGAFSINIPQNTDGVFLQASLIGYATQKQYVQNSQVECEIALKPSEKMLEPVVINSPYALRECIMTMGSTEMIKAKDLMKPDSTNDAINATVFKIADSVKKIFNAFKFNIYPNPAQRGQNVTLDTKKQGTYSIQLFNNSGKLLQVKEFNAIVGATQTMLNIPASFAAGLYYIRLFDDKTKKQYTDKLVVQ